MASGIVYYKTGWMASLDVDLKSMGRPTDDGKYKKVYIVMVRNAFEVGERAPISGDIDILIKTEDGKKLHYSGVIEGRAKNGNTKILLTSGGSEAKIKEIITKIGEQQNGRTSFTR